MCRNVLTLSQSEMCEADLALTLSVFRPTLIVIIFVYLAIIKLVKLNDFIYDYIINVTLQIIF